MAEPPRWERDGRDWPNRAASRFVSAGGLRWHVQTLGAGPTLLLLHGTGAATHSWRDLAPRLAADFCVIAPDLPGHGFTSAPAATADLSIAGMATGVAALLKAVDASPALVAGHSAGAPVLARMCLDGTIAPAGLVSLNGAFLPLAAMPAQIFSPVARLLARLPFVPHAFAWQAADLRVVERLMAGTGSTIDAAGMGFYARLMRRPGHAAAALGMMAHWDLPGLQRDLARLQVPLLQIIGANDRTIPPADAGRMAAMLPGTETQILPKLGHLAHEEAPTEVAAAIVAFARRLGVP